MRKLLLLKLKILKRDTLSFSLQNAIKLSSFLLVTTIFYFGIYSLLVKIFSFLYVEEYIGPVIITRLIAMTFSSFFFFLIISNIITSIPTFFRNPEVEYLFTLPLDQKKIFFSRLVENIIYASWASLIIDIPMITAYGTIYQGSVKYYFTSIASLLFFLLTTSSLGIFIIFSVLPAFLSFSRLRITFWILAVFSFMVMVYLSFKFNVLFKVPNITTMQEVLDYIKSLELPAFRFLPSEFFAEAMKTAVKPGFSFLKPLLAMLAYCAGGFLLLGASSLRYRKLFLTTPAVLNNSQKRKKNFPIIKGKFFRTARILTLKDMIVFLREPTQWGQSLILFLLLAIYLLGIINSSFNVRHPVFMTFISFANIAFVSYLMVTISVRFTYPAISLEGNSFWLMRTYTDLKTFIATKFMINLIPVLLVGLFLVSIGNFFLHTGFLIAYIGIINIFLFSWGITGINIGIGGLVPNFKEKNPSRLSAGAGGIISAVISLFYLVFSLLIMNQWAYDYFRKTFFFGGEVNFKLLALCQLTVALLTFLFAFPFPVLALKSLKKTNL
ncbi:hypothetical protein JXA84_06915 [candidate division WOR-3 bacterium]|nr:hypothetical protein [candidate division WOR-3 bacterium]